MSLIKKIFGLLLVCFGLIPYAVLGIVSMAENRHEAYILLLPIVPALIILPIGLYFLLTSRKSSVTTKRPAETTP